MQGWLGWWRTRLRRVGGGTERQPRDRKLLLLPLGRRDRPLAVLPDPRTRRPSHCLRCPRHGGEGVGVDTKVGGKTGGDLNTPDSAALKTFGFSQGLFPPQPSPWTSERLYH